MVIAAEAEALMAAAVVRESLRILSCFCFEHEQHRIESLSCRLLSTVFASAHLKLICTDIYKSIQHYNMYFIESGLNFE